MKNRPSFDEAEYRAHRAPAPPVPDAPPSLFDETNAYLSGAEERVASLTPLLDLMESVERVQPPAVPLIDVLNDMAKAAIPGARVVSDEGRYRMELPEPAPTKPSKAERGLGAVLKKNPPKGTVRNRDHGTSLEAALAVEPHLSSMQTAVLDAFRAHGPMTDEQLERLPEFADYKYSTARKRRTELVEKGLLFSCGKAPNISGSAQMTLWAIHVPRALREPAVSESVIMGNLAAQDARDAEDAEPLDCAFREEDETGRTIGERFNDSDPTY